MPFTLGLAQTGYPCDGNVLRQAQTLAARARLRGVELLAFPENFMSPRELSAPELATLAEPLDGPFTQSMASVARTHGLWIVFTMSEVNSADGPPFNTAVVLSSDGSIRGVYRKTHLYDAHGVRESDRMSAGHSLCAPIRTPFCTLGLGICYDLRFPEVARSLAVGGCDLVLFLAAWHDGPQKPLHWKTLLRARAIENECFVGGVCHGGQRYVRESHVYGPLGETCATGSGDLLVCSIDPHAVTSARDAMPVLSHRRPDLYT